MLLLNFWDGTNANFKHKHCAFFSEKINISLLQHKMGRELGGAGAKDSPPGSA